MVQHVHGHYVYPVTHYITVLNDEHANYSNKAYTIAAFVTSLTLSS